MSDPFLARQQLVVAIGPKVRLANYLAATPELAAHFDGFSWHPDDNNLDEFPEAPGLYVWEGGVYGGDEDEWYVGEFRPATVDDLERFGLMGTRAGRPDHAD